jgi:hypothetical protein
VLRVKTLHSIGKKIMFKRFVFSSLIAFSVSLSSLDLRLYTDKETLAYAPKQEGVKKKVEEKKEPEKGKLLLETSFLVWKARTSDSMYAVSAPKNDFSLPYRSSLYEMSFSFEPGFRVGAGWHSNHDSWTVGGLFTYFRTTQRSSVEMSSAGDLKNPSQFSSEVINSLLPGATGMVELYFQKAVSYYNLLFQDLSLSLSKSYLTGMVTFAPEIALEGVWLKGFQSSTYSKGQVLGNNYLRVNRKNRFAGLGPQTGLTMNWGLLKDWSLQQSLKASLLLGNLKSDYSEDLSNSLSTFMSLNGRDHRIVPHLSSTLGLGFDKTLKRFFSKIHADLLFEGHFLWNFNQKITFGRDMDFESLYLYGLSLNLGVDY